MFKFLWNSPTELKEMFIFKTTKMSVQSSKLNVSYLLNFGSDYIKLCCDYITNPFGKTHFNVGKQSSTPLWYKNKLKIDNKKALLEYKPSPI